MTRKLLFFQLRKYESPQVTEAVWVDRFPLGSTHFEMCYISAYGVSTMTSFGKVRHFNTKDAVSFILIKSGNGIWTSDGISVKIQRNDLLILRSNREHVISVPAGGHLRHDYILIPGNVLQTYLFSNVLADGTHLLHNAEELFAPLFRRILATISETPDNGVSSCALSLLVYEFLYTVWENFPRMQQGKEKFSSFLHSLVQTLGKNHTLSSLAESYSCSIPTIIRLFHKNCGMSPLRYLRKLRLEHAAKMLTHPELSITDVMKICGFRDKSYFIREFKTFSGSSPLKYKKAHSGNCDYRR